jgi:hypothetical protein
MDWTLLAFQLLYEIFVKLILKYNENYTFSECYKIECSQDNSYYNVITNYEENQPEVFKCSQEGLISTEQDNGSKFKCADPQIICSNKTACPNDCYHR